MMGFQKRPFEEHTSLTRLGAHIGIVESTSLLDPTDLQLARADHLKVRSPQRSPQQLKPSELSVDHTVAW
jgi:hypothetical protein